ncbi:hypothetical protein COM86_12585 [Priestia megaterium]|uniref:hypothetical protein n=1 Tax=Priestia megaterium TaxID=1404 RepID=UPI000BEC153C|nr:hypothetical protein [Priestia megaterium]MED3972281.1 hypothetical protein [Priestia megaterium]PEB63290.1 hypothetical protein COM86_12585 [Priestia megaterium]
MKSGNIEQFVHLSKFIDKDEFNNHIEQWMVDFKSQFTKSELIGLKRLIRYSCKYAGISNAKIQTLVSATHNNEIGISRSTFERMLRKAKLYGILTVHNTFCGSNQRHNVYVFNRYQSIKQVESQSSKNEVPETIDVPNQETNHAETNNILIDTYKDNVIPNVPSRFQELAKCYYSPKQVLELWKCVKYSTQHYNDFNGQYVDYDPSLDKVELAITSFKQMIVNIKLGYTIKKSIFSYYYGIIQKKLDTQFKYWKLNLL